MPSIEQQFAYSLGDCHRRLAAGEDISPAERYRLEGYLQALVDSDLISRTMLQDWEGQQRLHWESGAHQAPGAEAAEAVAGICWQIRLPMIMQRPDTGGGELR